VYPTNGLYFLYISESLESELLEKVTRPSRLLLAGNLFLVQITILKDLFQVLLHFHLLVAHEVSLVNNLLEVHVNLITGREYMTHIDVLHERLHGATPLLDLFLGHATGDLAWTTSDASDEAVRETLVVRVALFDVFDNNGLLAGVAASKNNNNLS